MGLDVYVGTLTRYYARQWETIVQRTGREQGFAVEVQRQHVNDAVTDPADLEPVLISWRDTLSDALSTHLSGPLRWDEGMGPEYFTDRPGWDCYGSLLVWAAHEEHAGTDLPSTAIENWTQHPAFMLSRAEGFRSRYGQLLHGAEFWLPAAFEFTFTAQDPAGNEIIFGSTDTLLQQLRTLNERTWGANGHRLAEWRRAGVVDGGPFETAARFGFAVLYDLAERAAERRLPMKLDY